MFNITTCSILLHVITIHVQDYYMFILLHVINTCSYHITTCLEFKVYSYYNKVNYGLRLLRDVNHLPAENMHMVYVV